MTKLRWPLLLVFVGALGVLAWYYFSQHQDDAAKRSRISVDSAPVLNGRRVMNLPPGREQEALKKLSLGNRPGPQWQEGLEQNLRQQGGDLLKEVKVDKIESLIWTQQGVALNVESVIISLTSTNGGHTQFRALVDSETGKVIQTWDQPLHENLGKREGIKPDARYFND